MLGRRDGRYRRFIIALNYRIAMRDPRVCKRRFFLLFPFCPSPSLPPNPPSSSILAVGILLSWQPASARANVVFLLFLASYTCQRERCAAAPLRAAESCVTSFRRGSHPSNFDRTCQNRRATHIEFSDISELLIASSKCYVALYIAGFPRVRPRANYRC